MASSSRASLRYDAHQVEERRAKYGYNRLTPPKQTPAWLQFVLQFTNFFSLLLIAAGVLCFVAILIDPSDETFLYLGIVLFLVVIATAVFSYYQDAKSAAIMEGFSKMIPKFTSAYRNGALVKVHPEELVPGDIVDLNEGDQIPADMRLFVSNEIKVDNSSLTGESEAIERGVDLLCDGVTGKPIDQELEANNLVFFSTTVESGKKGGGTGCMCVCVCVCVCVRERERRRRRRRRRRRKSYVLLTMLFVMLVFRQRPRYCDRNWR